MWQNGKIKSIYIDTLEFDKFKNVIFNNFVTGVRYSLLFKIKYNSSFFGMLGPQQGFILNSINDIDSIRLLHQDLMDRIENFMDKYNSEDIELIQIMYVVISGNPKLKLTNINSITLNRDLVNIKDTKVKFSSKFLPLTINTTYFGKLLVGEDYDLYLDKINKQRKLLNRDLFEDSVIESIYLYNDKYIIVNYIINNNKISRYIFSANSGVYLESVTDIIINKNIFIRNIGNMSITIKKDKVISIKINKELSYIKYQPKYSKELPNPYIGSLDLEAFIDLDGYAKVYAIGYAVDKETTTLYINKNQNSDDLVLNCLDLMISKYSGYIFYTHNFGKYDSIFIIKILTEANKRKGFNYYKLESVYKDNVLLKLTIKVKHNRITIIDSYNLLNAGLYKLSRSFGITVVKGHFPHKFVNRDTLYYIGKTPDIEYWYNMSKDEYRKFINKGNINGISDKYITKDEYKDIIKEDWNLKEECITYLKMDLESLLNVMKTFNRYILMNYDIQMTECNTISRLALNMYFKHYLKDSKLPIIKSHIFNDIKQAYYGGVTEVYKPYGKNLYYYDVNSLYPYSALNSMSGNKCVYLENINNSLNISDLFGFFYCEIECSENYLGLLPVRTKLGLIMPNGKWSGWYFSEELKFAVLNGYKVKVLKGYNFNKQDNVFKDYVNDLYKIKSNNKGHIKVIAKSLLNNLLGRFGMNINKPITEIVDKEKLDLIWVTREFYSLPRELTENDYLVSYYPGISPDICKSHGIDYIQALKTKFDMEKDKEMKDVSLSTAAAVTAYSRIFMSKIKLDILNKGGEIYYTDTDSIVTNIPLDNDLVGNKLGQFKLEYKIKEGYFISAKTYCLVLNDNSLVIKVKGLFNNWLNLDDFKNLYKGIDIKGMKQDTITVYSEGSVVIDKKEISLNSDSYRKRIKLYENGKWYDTKPIIFNSSTILSDKSHKSSNKLIDTNFKRGLHTYTENYWTNLYNNLLYITFDIIKTLLILIAFVIFSIIWLSFSDYGINNIELLEQNTNVIEVFKDNNHISANWKTTNQFIQYDKIIDKSNITANYNDNYTSSKILNEVYKKHLLDANSEIEQLKEEISSLKIKLIGTELQLLDSNNSINETLKYMDRINNNFMNNIKSNHNYSKSI
jgi:DNA polymerase type B, organellar and viral